jgi:hypothetical protein
LRARIDDKQHAEAALLAAGERACEEDESSLGERIHERCVLVECRLLLDSSGRLTNDSEEAHARASR